MGVLIQILDDLDDLDPESWFDLADNHDGLSSTLPFVYAMEVSNKEEQEKLLAFLNSEKIKKEMFSEMISLINESGAGIYIFAEIAKHRSKAIEALIKADPMSPAKEMLTSRLEKLGTL